MCILYNQRNATYTMFFINISALHVSGGFSTLHQELIKLCAALGFVLLSCCLPLVWMDWNCSAYVVGVYPLSGAYKTVCAALGVVVLSCCLPLVWMGWNCSAYNNLNISNQSRPAVDSRKAWQYPRLHIQFYKLLMMGRKTARNM
jgi:hypothetical protein